MNENPMEQVEQTPETPAAEPVSAPEQKKGLSENAKEWIKDILIAIVVAFLVLQFIKPTIVQEHSMENTLVANDYLFISKQSYRLFGDPQRGDIIVFHSSLTTSDGSEKLLVKRIIAIPGDTTIPRTATPIRRWTRSTCRRANCSAWATTGRIPATAGTAPSASWITTTCWAKRCSGCSRSPASEDCINAWKN